MHTDPQELTSALIDAIMETYHCPEEHCGRYVEDYLLSRCEEEAERKEEL